MPKQERKGSCPYAIGLDEDEQSQSSLAVGGILEQAKRSCPAFEGGVCPFSNATSAVAVREALVKIPSSHYQDGRNSFTKIIQHLHAVAPSINEKEFQIAECPVQPFFREEEEQQQQVPFHKSLEDSSLAAIMSRMAREFSPEGHDDDDDDDEDVSDEELENAQISLAAMQTAPVEKRGSRLSIAFKTGTAVSHQAAEDVHFVKNFIRGQIDRDLYSDLVVSLYHVYKALEDELDVHASAHFATCHFPKELYRTTSLEEDLDFWRGETLPKDISPATQDYVDRIHRIAQEDPILLLSHAYTRYLGDLSGGKVLRRVAKRAMDLDDDGLAFFDFPAIASPKLFKDKYRLCLDQLNLTPEQVMKLVVEANIAFILNMRVFEELDVKANVPGAKVRSLEDAYALVTAVEEQEDESKGEESCPFLQQQQQQQGQHRLQEKGRCPWPFIFAHDPMTGLKDVQTWIVVGLLLSWVWSRFV